MYSLVGSGLDMIRTSDQLGNLGTMGGLGWSIRDIDQKFITVPVVDRGDGANVLWTAAADELWESLRNDTPVDEEYLKTVDAGLSNIYTNSAETQEPSSTQSSNGSPDNDENSYNSSPSPAWTPTEPSSTFMPQTPTSSPTTGNQAIPSPSMNETTPVVAPTVVSPQPTQSEEFPFSAPTEPSQSTVPNNAGASEDSGTVAP